MSEFPTPNTDNRPSDVMARVDFIAMSFDPIDLHTAWRMANANRLVPNRKYTSSYEALMLRERNIVERKFNMGRPLEKINRIILCDRDGEYRPCCERLLVRYCNALSDIPLLYCEDKNHGICKSKVKSNEVKFLLEGRCRSTSADFDSQHCRRSLVRRSNGSIANCLKRLFRPKVSFGELNYIEPSELLDRRDSFIGNSRENSYFFKDSGISTIMPGLADSSETLTDIEPQYKNSLCKEPEESIYVKADPENDIPLALLGYRPRTFCTFEKLPQNYSPLPPRIETPALRKIKGNFVYNLYRIVKDLAIEPTDFYMPTILD